MSTILSRCLIIQIKCNRDPIRWRLRMVRWIWQLESNRPCYYSGRAKARFERLRTCHARIETTNADSPTQQCVCHGKGMNVFSFWSLRKSESQKWRNFSQRRRSCDKWWIRAPKQVIWDKIKHTHSKVDWVDSYYLEIEGEVVKGLRMSVCSCSPLSSMTEVTKPFVQWRLEMGKTGVKRMFEKAKKYVERLLWTMQESTGKQVEGSMPRWGLRQSIYGEN